MSESLQQKAKRQQREITEFLEGYDILSPRDPRLEGCKEIIKPVGLRNWSQKEYLWTVCLDFLGINGGTPRTHYLVDVPDRENFVELWAEDAPPLPDYVTASAAAGPKKRTRKPGAPVRGAGSQLKIYPDPEKHITMQETKIEAIANKSAEQLRTLIIEQENDITEAIAHIYQAAQDKEQDTGTPQKVKVTLNHTIVLDMSENTQTDRLSYSVAHKAELSSTIPDPDSPELPGIHPEEHID